MKVLLPKGAFFKQKILQKLFFPYSIVFIIKTCFPLHVCKVFFSKPGVCNLQPMVSNSEEHKHELFV